MTAPTFTPGPAESCLIDPKAELSIEIFPRGWVIWTGPRAQLEAEGLIPDALQWPELARTVEWKAGGFDFCLRRCRPSGLKGPRKLWIDGDYWFLRRIRPITPGVGFLEALIYEKERELQAAIYLGTADYAALSARCAVARWDSPFQRFKSALLGARRPGPRCYRIRKGAAS